MNEKDIEIITKKYKDEKEPLYEKIHNRIEALFESKDKKKKSKREQKSITKRNDDNC